MKKTNKPKLNNVVANYIKENGGEYPTADQISVALKNENPLIRMAYVSDKFAGNFGGHYLTDQQIEDALNDNHWQIKCAVLNRMRPNRSNDLVLSRIQMRRAAEDRSWRVRLAAFSALKRSDMLITEDCAIGFKDSSPEIRAYLLKNSSFQLTREEMLSAVGDKETIVRQAVFARRNSGISKKEIESALKDNNKVIAALASNKQIRLTQEQKDFCVSINDKELKIALAKCGFGLDERYTYEFIKNKDTDVRMAFFTTIYGANYDIDMIEQGLIDEDPKIRAYVVDRAWYREDFDDPITKKQFLRGIKDKDLEVKMTYLKLAIENRRFFELIKDGAFTPEEIEKGLTNKDPKVRSSYAKVVVNYPECCETKLTQEQLDRGLLDRSSKVRIEFLKFFLNQTKRVSDDKYKYKRNYKYNLYDEEIKDEFEDEGHVDLKYFKTFRDKFHNELNLNSLILEFRLTDTDTNIRSLCAELENLDLTEFQIARGFTDRDGKVRAAFVCSYPEKLNKKQIEKLVSDPELEVRRKIFSDILIPITQSQVNKAIKDEQDDFLLYHYILCNDKKFRLNKEQLDCLFNRGGDIRSDVIQRKDFKPNEVQIEQAMNDGYWYAREQISKRDDIHLTNEQIQAGLNDIDWKVRKSFYNRDGVKFTDEQIKKILNDKYLTINSKEKFIMRDGVILTDEQVEFLLKSKFAKIRAAAASLGNFTYTKDQIKRGLEDKRDYVREIFQKKGKKQKPKVHDINENFFERLKQIRGKELFRMLVGRDICKPNKAAKIVESRGFSYDSMDEEMLFFKKIRAMDEKELLKALIQAEVLPPDFVSDSQIKNDDNNSNSKKNKEYPHSMGSSF